MELSPSTRNPALEVSPLNAVAIRESGPGQYLESINTGGTWVQSIQESLGLEPTQFTALDALYAFSGAAGLALLTVTTLGTGTVLVGATLVGISAVGLSEPERRTKIGAGIAVGTTLITNPKAVGFVVKEAYGASKEAVKQTATLVNSTIGPVMIGLGTVTAGAFALVATSKQKRGSNKRKRTE